MTKLNHLFQPLKVGNGEIANRLVMSCMAGGLSLDAEGYPEQRMIDYYAERAKGRPGMMGLGAGAVVVPFGETPGTKRRPYAAVLYDDGCIEPMKKLTDAIHAYDTKIGIQLWDGGIQSGGRFQLTPSGIGSSFQAVGDLSEASQLHTLTIDEIHMVVRQFGDAAVRAEKAGFDFVEIHAGHGYLIGSFYTPFYNRRTDEYGGSYENRIRFLLEILREVKGRVSANTIVGVKINGSDFLPEQGWELEDACRLAPILEAEGADYLSVTAGVMGSPRLTVPPMYEPQACFLELGEAIKKTVKIPVGVVGRIKNVVMADDLIRTGKVDMVSMGRPFIADPEIAEKARQGNVEDIRPCLSDCRGCLEHQMRTIKRGEKPGTSCIVNPRVHREAECIDVPNNKADNPRNILVIGAGVAGLEAARRAAFSGHKVTLCDRRAKIGGQLTLAEKIPGRHEIGDIVPWYGRQIEKLGVDVRLNTEANEALVNEIKPDVVIVATGSLPSVPQNLTTSLYNIENIQLVMGDDLIENNEKVGMNVVVLGGEQIGMQIADYISERGAQVYVLEETGHFAGKMAANDRWYLTSRLISKKVQRIKKVRSFEVAAGDKVLIGTDAGVQELPGIDTIVLASERQSERSLAEICEKLGIETHVIGDAQDVLTEDSGTIFANLVQGYDLARHL